MSLRDLIEAAGDAYGRWAARGLVFVLIYGVFFVAVATSLGPELELHHRGVQTVGRVIAKEPKNHQSIRYRYAVGSETYEGSSGPWPLDITRVGDTVTVTYLERAPKVSVAGTPNVDGWWFLPFVIMPAFAAIGAYVAERRISSAAQTRA